MSLLKLFTFLLSNLAILVTAFLFVMRLYKYKIDNLVKVVIGVFTLFCAEIIIIEILLGLFGAISYANVSIFVYLLLLLSLVVFGKGKIIYEVKKIPKADVLKLSLVFAVPIFLLAAKYFNTILQIPLEYDSVAYHLPFVAEWLHAGSLMKLYYSVFAGPIAYYPSNHELLSLWTVLPFRNDFFAQLINFPLFVFLVTGLCKILRNLKIGGSIAILCASIPLYMPVFLHQAGTSLVDLFFISFFVISIFYLQEIFKSKEVNIGDFLLFGTATGLFIGTKYLGLIYGLIILSIAVVYIVYRKIKKSSPIFKALAAFCVPVILTGSFFYIRNWIDSGNPLFPVDVNIFGIHFLEGYDGINENLLSTSLISSLHSLADIKTFLINFFYIAGPFGIILIFLFVMNLGLLLKQFFNKNKNYSDILRNIFLITSLLLFFFLYIRSPYTFKDMTQNVRYAMPFLIMGCLDIGYLISRIKFLKPIFYLTSSLIFAYSFAFIILNPPDWILYGDRLLLDFGILWAYKEYLLMGVLGLFALFFAIQIFLIKRNKFLVVFSIALVCLSVFLEIKVMNFAYQERELLVNHFTESIFAEDQKNLDLMRAVEWLDINAPHANIAYSGFNYHYHLYGRDLSREVDYININECLDCRYVDYKNSADSVRRDPDYENWLSNLKAKKKEYLVITPVISPVRNYEFEWAGSNDRIFQEVFNANDTYIFRVKYD